MAAPAPDHHHFLETDEKVLEVNLTTEKTIGSMVFSDHPPILRKDITDTQWTDGKAFLVVFMSVINVFMLFGNTLSIVTICSTPKLRTQVSYWFVLNLAVIDFIISVTVVPLNTVWEYYGTWPLSQTTCEFFTFADISFSTISAYSIVLVSIDKYLYITYSIHYYDKMTRKLAIVLIIAVWIAVFIFATISILTEVGTDEQYRDHFLELPNNTHICIFVMTDAFVLPSAILCFFVPFLILCFTSSKIICIASKHIKKIHSMSMCVIDTESDIIRAATAMQRPTARRHTMNGYTGSFKNGDKLHTHSSLLRTIKSENDCMCDLNQNSTHPTISNITSTIQEEELSRGNTTSEINKNDIGANCAEKTDEEQISTDKNDENQISVYAKLKEQNEDDHASIKFDIKSDDDQSQTLTYENRTQQNKITDTEIPIRIPMRSKSVSMRSELLRQTESIKSLTRRTSPYCKLFGTVTIVIACFIVMFAPYNIAIVIDVPCHCIEPWVYEDILAVLYYMHSLVNPYIYMATDRKYKAALKVLWFRIKTKFNHICVNKCNGK